jgi:hypothetical protein
LSEHGTAAIKRKKNEKKTLAALGLAYIKFETQLLTTLFAKNYLGTYSNFYYGHSK